jgi:hypothetical protein
MKKFLSLLILAAIAAGIMRILQEDAAAEASRMEAIKARAKAANPRVGITETVDRAIGTAAAEMAAPPNGSGDTESA